jgi:hypothetical protein
VVRSRFCEARTQVLSIYDTHSHATPPSLSANGLESTHGPEPSPEDAAMAAAQTPPVYRRMQHIFPRRETSSRSDRPIPGSIGLRLLLHHIRVSTGIKSTQRFKRLKTYMMHILDGLPTTKLCHKICLGGCAGRSGSQKQHAGKPALNTYESRAHLAT